MERYIKSLVHHYFNHGSFEESVVGQNMLRIFIIGGLYSAIECIGLTLSFLGFFQSNIRMYVFAIVLFHLFYLPFLALTYRKRVFKKIQTYEFLTNIYYSVMVLWGSLFTILVYIQKEDIMIYSIVLFFISAVFLIEPNRSSIIYLSSYMLFTALVYKNISVIPVANGIAFKALIVCITALVISHGNYLIRKRLFDSQKTLEEKNEELKEQSLRDSLTKLYNNRYIFEFLENETQVVSKTGGNLSLLMLDLDNFKHINDTYGHLFGDKVIKDVSQAILDSTRANDIVGRYGGEEFIAVLTDTDKVVAVEIAERIRKKIASLEFETVDDDLSITVSIGVSEMSEQTAFNLVHAADGNLYKAKRNGKNRVVA